MALTTTTTSAAITASQLRLPITNTASGFPAVGSYGQRQRMTIDGEDMLIIGVPIAGMVDVIMRGYNGTTAKQHDAQSNVATSANDQDFAALGAGQIVSRPPFVDDIVTVGTDQTITVPFKNTTYLLNKATALAVTLSSGTAAQLGIRMTFIAENAVAHVLTYTPGFNANTTSSDTATFSGVVGAALMVEVSANGLLTALSTSNVTIG